MVFEKTLAEAIYKGLTQFSSSSDLEHELNVTDIKDLIEIPKNESMGDLAFPCFILSKKLKKSPVQIAKELETILESDFDKDKFSSIKATGPYLNFRIHPSFLAHQVLEGALSGTTTHKRPEKNLRMMIEYSQPNTHKAFHVGHIRNAALGESVVHLHRWAGYDVVAANYIGDVGTHIAKCLWYYKKFYDGETPKENLGEFLGSFYEKGNDLLDFSRITHIAHKAPISAQVLNITSHPKSEKLKLVELQAGTLKTQVVCGGHSYKENDIVAYVPVGSQFKGRIIQCEEVSGVKSHGMICSEAELDLSLEKNKIFTLSDFTTTSISQNDLEAIQFSKDVALGVPLALLFTKPHVELETENVITEITTFENEVQEILKKFEAKDPEYLDLWEKTRKWSLDDFDKVYSWLGTPFDHFFYESDVGDEGKEIVKSAYEKGILIKSEGAIGADLSDFNLPFFLLLKSNGTGLYSTKDIALAQKKFEDFKIEKNVYVVGVDQSLHFQQVFKTLELLGFEHAKNSVHFPYAMVERPDGKMSSRKGNVILFSQLKSLLMSKIKTDFLDKYKGDWSEDEIEEAAHHISVATIKYGMLNQDNNKKIIFDLDEWTARTGNTGPYLMYAYARTQSILKEAFTQSLLNEESDILSQIQPLIETESLTHEAELTLLKNLSQFEKVTLRACEQFEPQNLCIYLYQLSKDFSGFYTKCPILKAETDNLKKLRLGLMIAFSNCLKSGLSLLGITTVSKM